MFIEGGECCSFWKRLDLRNLIFILWTSLTFFSLSWKQLFKNKKSLWNYFLFQVLPTTVLFDRWYLSTSLGARYLIPFFGIDMNNMNFLARITTPAGITIITIIGLSCSSCGSTFQLICSYLSSQGLAWNFQNKSYTLKSLVKSWRGMWPWAGTGLAVVAQFLAIFLVGFILALGFAYIHEYLALIPGVLTIRVFIFFRSHSLFSPRLFFEWKNILKQLKYPEVLFVDVGGKHFDTQF